MDRTNTEQLEMLLAQSAAMHHHLCPRQVLGVRMGMLAARLLDMALPRQRGKDLLTIVETDGCFVDGVAVATGCSMGHRTMRLVDYGKVAAVFIDTRAKLAYRIVPHPLSRQRAPQIMPDARSRWHSYLDAYQVMPDEDLFRWQQVRLNFSLEALKSHPRAKVICAGCGEEVINEREVQVDGQTLCRACAGTPYYLSCDENSQQEALPRGGMFEF